MADGFIRLPDDAANLGKYLDTSPVTVGGNSAHRQRMNLADPATATSLQAVKAASTPAALVDCAAVVALSPSSPVTLKKLRDVAATVVAIKASPGVLFGLQILNTTGAAAYVQIFDVATGGVTLATTTPDMEFLVPTGAELIVPLPDRGVNFATAISIASTTTEKGLTGSAAGVQVFAQYV